MILFWCACVCLMLGGLAFRQEVRAALEGLRLRLFGVRVRVPLRREPLPAPDRPVAFPSRQGSVPPPRVRTRGGP
jgi:hypothetical protein